jgi:hypothetical protein
MVSMKVSNFSFDHIDFKIEGLTVGYYPV